MLRAAQDLQSLIHLPEIDHVFASTCAPILGDTGRVELRRWLSPGPLEPETTAGRVLQQVLKTRPASFERYLDSELQRLASAHSEAATALDIIGLAEALLLGVYARYLEITGAPPRPNAATEGVLDEYRKVFGATATTALDATVSMDFRSICAQHVSSICSKDTSEASGEKA